MNDLKSFLNGAIELESIINIRGGRASIVPTNEPHDLVTPAEPAEPYGSLDVDELDL